MDAAAQVGAFVVALAINAACGSRLGTAAQDATACMAPQGANPSLWAFSIWGLIYALFTAAYFWFAISGATWAELPTLLAVSWCFNAAWVIASTTNNWKLALVIIVGYLASVCVALPRLAKEQGAAALLGIACGVLAVWLCAALLLNLQLACPCVAAFVGSSASVWVVVGTALIILLSSPGATWPTSQRTACVGTAVWVLVALTGALGETLV